MAAKRLRKSYEKPKKLWEKGRIETERKLREEYGLKNSREVWKMQTRLRRIRREARRLLSQKGTDVEMRSQMLIKRIKKFLIRRDIITLDDILSLTVRDMLERRLQTIVYKKHLAKTISQARQLISHGHIAVGGVRVSAPSFLVNFDDEGRIEWYGHAVKIDNSQKPAKESGEGRVAPGISDASELTKKSEN